MIIKNSRKSISLENLEQGAVFQKGNDIYIKTDGAYRIFSSISSSGEKCIKKDIACVNLENGHISYFSINENVYFYNAELIL